MSLRAAEFNLSCFDDLTTFNDPPKPPPKKSSANALSFNAVVIFDHIKADVNGFTLEIIRDALVSEVPLFCQRSTLKGETFVPGTRQLAFDAKTEVETLLTRDSRPFQIFTDCIFKEQLLILPPDFDTSNLDSYGINSKKLLPSTPDTIFSNRTPYSSYILDFTEMFSSESDSKVHLVVAGHGLTDSSVAGLPLHSYKQFLSRLNEINCQALYVISCFAGGLNKRYHIPTHFPLIIQSAGHFESFHTKTDFNEFFKKITRVTEHPKGPSVQRFKAAFATKTLIEKWRNLRQVKLPNKRLVPLNEDRSSMTIGRKASKKHNISNPTRLINLQVKHITAPTHFNYALPIFNSLLQEPMHAFNSATTKVGLFTFVRTTVDAFSDLRELGTYRQLIFFKEIKALDATYNNVLLICSASDRRKFFAYDSQKNEYAHYSLDVEEDFKKHPIEQRPYFERIRELLPKKFHTLITE